MSVYVIAEAGINHNGSFEIAKQLIDTAKTAGADCVKFQTFKTESLVLKNAPKAEYQVKNTHDDNSQFNMLKKLELSFDEFISLKKYCDKVGIDFMSTPFDFDSITFLADLEMKYWKVPSGEITNLPYLIKIAKYKRPVILSTGMSTMKEIQKAVKILNDNGTADITLLHCTTEYPVQIKDVNLRAMETMHTKFNLPVGYSDHTTGIIIPIAAVAMGATIIEKHFTLDKNMTGPDHKASLEPNELCDMVAAIRMIELSLGNSDKFPSESELKNRVIARKSIVAACLIKEGEIFTEDNLTVKRPGTGISPMEWFNILGKTAIKDFKKDEFIMLG